MPLWGRSTQHTATVEEYNALTTLWIEPTRNVSICDFCGKRRNLHFYLAKTKQVRTWGLNALLLTIMMLITQDTPALGAYIKKWSSSRPESPLNLTTAITKSERNRKWIPNVLHTSDQPCSRASPLSEPILRKCSSQRMVAPNCSSEHTKTKT